MARGRRPRSLPTLTRAEQTALERVCSTPGRVGARGRMIRDLVAGQPIGAVATKHHVSRWAVMRWRDRFGVRRLAGLDDEPGRGRSRELASSDRARVRASARSTGAGTRSVAHATGQSRTSVQRILRGKLRPSALTAMARLRRELDTRHLTPGDAARRTSLNPQVVSGWFRRPGDSPRRPSAGLLEVFLARLQIPPAPYRQLLELHSRRWLYCPQAGHEGERWRFVEVHPSQLGGCSPLRDAEHIGVEKTCRPCHGKRIRELGRAELRRARIRLTDFATVERAEQGEPEAMAAVQRATVNAALEARGLTRRPLDRAQLDELRRRRRNGETWRAIALRMGIPFATLRRRWREASARNPQFYTPFVKGSRTRRPLDRAQLDELRRRRWNGETWRALATVMRIPRTSLQRVAAPRRPPRSLEECLEEIRRRRRARETWSTIARALNARVPRRRKRRWRDRRRDAIARSAIARGAIGRALHVSSSTFARLGRSLEAQAQPQHRRAPEPLEAQVRRAIRVLSERHGGWAPLRELQLRFGGKWKAAARARELLEHKREVERDMYTLPAGPGRRQGVRFRLRAAE